MKKDVFLIFVLIFIVGLIFINDFTGFSTMKIGESSEVEGHIIEIDNIGPDHIKILVDGKKGLVRRGDERTINDVKIKVDNIFYVDEIEQRFAEISLEGISVVVEEEEVVESTNLNECRVASNCDDGDPETTDLCMGSPRKCVNKIIVQCEKDLDCDDEKDETKDSCKNGDCFNEKISGVDTHIEEPSESETIEEESISIKKEESFFSKLIRWLKGNV